MDKPDCQGKDERTARGIRPAGAKYYAHLPRAMTNAAACSATAPIGNAAQAARPYAGRLYSQALFFTARNTSCIFYHCRMGTGHYAQFSDPRARMEWAAHNFVDATARLPPLAR